jgi:uncharacterized protein (DUF58 family)
MRRFSATYKPTWRSLFLLLLVLLCLGLSYYWFWMWVGLLGVTAVTLLALWFDSKHTPGPAGFALAREHSQQMTLAQLHPVTIMVENLTAQTLDVEVWEAAPPSFTMIGPGHGRHAPWFVGLKAYGRTQFSYQLRPNRRGDHAFGELALRWTSTWGVVMRQATYAMPTRVKGYPNRLQMRQ